MLLSLSQSLCQYLLQMPHQGSQEDKGSVLRGLWLFTISAWSWTMVRCYSNNFSPCIRWAVYPISRRCFHFMFHLCTCVDAHARWFNCFGTCKEARRATEKGQQGVLSCDLRLKVGRTVLNTLSSSKKEAAPVSLGKSVWPLLKITQP